jgi:hypothetical protein
VKTPTKVEFKDIIDKRRKEKKRDNTGTKKIKKIKRTKNKKVLIKVNKNKETQLFTNCHKPNR